MIELQAGFTKTVGLELAQKGNITCNAICPGYVLTDLIKNQLEATSKARGIPKVTPPRPLLKLKVLKAQYKHALQSVLTPVFQVKLEW